jgi:hypothetical protein
MLKLLTDYDFIDVHYHANPDLYRRRYNAIEVGALYKKHNGVVVLKNHLGSTAVQATLAQSLGYPVLPSVVLNDIAGGIDYKVVVRALLEYIPLLDARMIVHLPTITGRTHQSKLERQLSSPGYTQLSQKPLTVFNEQGQLKQEVRELIRMSSNDPIVLSTGHASKEETYALIEESGKYNQCKLMLNQPANPLTGLDAEALLEIAKESHVFIEQTALTYLLGYQTKEDFQKVLKVIPQVIYSSDLGQTSQMDIENYIDESREYFKTFAITNKRKEELWKFNPIKMLSL